MKCLTYTVSFRGIETVTVSVQVHISNGLPAMAIVGLADKAVAESKERVRAALSSLGLSLPAKRIAVNLAPADLVKEGAHFDLPIALGLMTAMGVLPADSVVDYLVLGELSLDGSVQPVTGTLPAALTAAAQNKRIICPAENGLEAGWAGQIDVVAASSLTQLVNHLRGTQVIAAPERKLPPSPPAGPDMAELKGQQTARRVLEIAAAGGHHLLMVGPPGAGKSMVAARLPSLLDIEALEPIELMTESAAETSAEVRDRIAAARRFAGHHRPETALHLNAKLSASDIQKDIELTDTVQALLTQAMDKQNLSARGFHKILRVARTIADLAGSVELDRINVLEALSYRRYFLFGAVNG